MIGHKLAPAEGTVVNSHPGTVMRLEINEKTGGIRLNPYRDKRIVSFGHGYVGTDPDDFAPPRPVPTVTVTGPGGADFAHIFGGAQVVIGGNDASDMLRTLKSGDPADGGFSTAPDGGFSILASPSDRLALLERMLERGQLSQAEFDAKRQQMLDQIWPRRAG